MKKVFVAALMLSLILMPNLNPPVEGKNAESRDTKRNVLVEVVEYKASKPACRKLVLMDKEKAEHLFKELMRVRNLEKQVSVLKSYELVEKDVTTDGLKEDAESYARTLGIVDEKGNFLVPINKGVMFLGYIAAIGNGTVFLAKGSIDGIPRPHLLLLWRLEDTLFSAAGVFGRVVYREGCISRGMALGFFGYGTYVRNPPGNWRERTGVILGFFAATRFNLKDGLNDFEVKKPVKKSNFKEFRGTGESFNLFFLNNKIVFNPYSTNSFDVHTWFNREGNTL